MGNFVHHSAGALISGAACSAMASMILHLEVIDSAACGVLCAISSLLPDIDSPTSRPAEFVISMVSAIIPAFIVYKVHMNGPSQTILIIVLSYFATRVLIQQIISRLTVHRGMIHSIPSLFIWTSIVFLICDNAEYEIRTGLAASAAIGFLTHLIIDELFSMIDIAGGKFAPKKSAGTALKFTSSSIPATFLSYICLALLLWLCIYRN
jgi:membrane-bound metal-dependent hydrolase YbcI (DUF457 family)